MLDMKFWFRLTEGNENPSQMRGKSGEMKEEQIRLNFLL